MNWLTWLVPGLPSLRWRLAQEWYQVRTQARALGWPAAVRLGLTRWHATTHPSAVWIPGIPGPVWFRPRSSDPLVLHQVFVEQEYGCALKEADVEFVVDLGANIGCVTRLLLQHYPQARAVVVEPDPQNLTLARRNLARFQDRVLFVAAGVWAESVPMIVERGTFRDGAEWSFQVRPVRPGETPDFVACTIPELLQLSGFPRIDVLKMDIEAAEETVFRHGAAAWVSRVRTLVVELHNPACQAAAEAALTATHERIGQSGDLTLFRRRSSRVSV